VPDPGPVAGSDDRADDGADVRDAAPPVGDPEAPPPESDADDGDPGDGSDADGDAADLSDEADVDDPRGWVPPPAGAAAPCQDDDCRPDSASPTETVQD
jgi:hypothetical protein